MRSSQSQLSSPGLDSEAPLAGSTGGGHNHHWRIEEQGAASSRGTCLCGSSRLFFNGWNDERDGWHGRLNARTQSSQ